MFLFRLINRKINLHRCRHSFITVGERISPWHNGHLNRESTRGDSTATLFI
jgi:hypothetical protein